MMDYLNGHVEARDLESATHSARQLAAEWHSGQASALYGFASTGDLRAWGRALAELPTMPTPHLHGAELEANRALVAYAELAARDGRCGPVVDLTERRYVVVDDGSGGSDAEYLDTDENGAPEFYTQVLEFVEPDADDLEEGHTAASLAVDALRRHASYSHLEMHGDGEARTYGEAVESFRADGSIIEPVAFLYGFSSADLATIARIV